MKSDEDVDVRPTDGLVPIQPRTRHGRLLGTTAVAVATAAVIVGSVLIFHGGRGPAPSAAPPGPTRPQDSATSTTTGPTEGFAPALPIHNLEVYFLGRSPHGVRLYPELEPLSRSNTLGPAVQRSVNGGAGDPDYYSGFPHADVTVRSHASTIAVNLVGNGAALKSRPAGMSAADAQTALQAVVYTADVADDSTKPVRFTINGRPAATVLGVPLHGPVGRTSAESVEASVQVSGPVEGASVTSPFMVSGLASTFEANVVWELKQGDTVVQQHFTTARECCVLSPYSFTVTAPPGNYTLVVHDDDESDGEGHGTTEDTKDITVR